MPSHNSAYSLLYFRYLELRSKGHGRYLELFVKMVHVCCVPACSSRSDCERDLSFFSLPLKDKKVLKQWIHLIGRANLPLNRSTRICSRHFVKAAGRKLYPGEVPSKELPVLSTTVKPSKCRRPPKQRPLPVVERETDSSPAKDTMSNRRDIGVNTEWDFFAGLEAQATRIHTLEGELLQVKMQKHTFRLKNIANNDRMVAFYTGFPSYSALHTCFKFFGPAVDFLRYSGGNGNEPTSDKRFRPHALPPLEEFFLALVRLRLGLLEQDLAYRFGVS